MPCDHEAVLEALARDAGSTPSPERLTDLDRTVAQFESSDEVADRMVVARALHDKVRLLFQLGRAAEVAPVLEELRSRFAHAEPEIRRWVCSAHFGAAGELRGPATDRRIDFYELALEVASAEPAVDELAAESLYNMGCCGHYRDRKDPVFLRSEEAFRELERRFLPSRDPRVARWVSAGFLVWATRFHPESEEAKAIFTTIEQAYGKGSEELQERALAILGEWGRRLMRGKPELAIEVLERGWDRFNHLKTPGARTELAAGRLNRALLLGRVRDSGAEIAAYEELLETFWDSPFPAVQRWVVAAAENQAWTLHDAGNDEQARLVLGRALERFGAATEPPELVQAITKAQRTLARLHDG